MPHLDPETAEDLEVCPFCAGREHRTPPETLRIGGPWQVRVVPNLYPAFDRHEVVVHAPRHVRSMAELSPGEVDAVAEAWRERAHAARGEGFDYVHAFVNEGRIAGASLPHSHSQLVWLREPPPVVQAECGEPCRLCALLADELAGGRRIVAERDGLVVLAPPASRTPYELLVAPGNHEDAGLTSPLLPAALRALVDSVRALRAVEGPVPWNAWLHAEGHWHLELVPRLAAPAGVELGAGIWITTVSPEEAAARLREASAA